MWLGVCIYVSVCVWHHIVRLWFCINIICMTRPSWQMPLRTLCVRVYATPPSRTAVMPHCPPQQRQNCDCDSKPPHNLFRATITNLVNSLAATITIKASTTKITSKANMFKKALATIKTITIKAIANVEDTDSCDVVSQMNCFRCYFAVVVAQLFFTALPINPSARWKNHVGQQAVVTAAFTRWWLLACRLLLAAFYAFVLLAVVVFATVQFKFAAIARKLCYNYSCCYCCCCCYFFIFAVATDTVEPPRWGMRQIIKMSCCRRLPANASQRQQKQKASALHSSRGGWVEGGGKGA